ncbi:hypothetical protein QBC46DRAFT_21846 [Diplogelasinospora grovesii]|uniref:Uncharacterized protein n=1 Tax=Diplogelasinospora grovesii TaxID=303347 RepID=A0AAN6NE66_9PEZI|nr:hypothetical protein QBC46DRAFT_21846 [Diplogelasinospora grovesii]
MFKTHLTNQPDNFIYCYVSVAVSFCGSGESTSRSLLSHHVKWNIESTGLWTEPWPKCILARGRSSRSTQNWKKAGQDRRVSQQLPLTLLTPELRQDSKPWWGLFNTKPWGSELAHVHMLGGTSVGRVTRAREITPRHFQSTLISKYNVLLPRICPMKSFVKVVVVIPSMQLGYLSQPYISNALSQSVSSHIPIPIYAFSVCPFAEIIICISKIAVLLPPSLSLPSSLLG